MHPKYRELMLCVVDRKAEHTNILALIYEVLHFQNRETGWRGTHPYATYGTIQCTESNTRGARTYAHSKDLRYCTSRNPSYTTDTIGQLSQPNLSLRQYLLCMYFLGLYIHPSYITFTF